jgi:NarL family two-component system response regulator LiaR
VTGKTTVVIVDDHELIRRGLTNFIELADDVQVVGQAGSGAEAVRMTQQLRPDVVLMDLIMPEMDGVATTREIKRRVPGAQVIALTSYHSEDLVMQALQAGAIGFLLKDVGAMGLREAIRAAGAGRSILAPHAAEAVIKRTTGGVSVAQRGQDLTDREREVLQLMVAGLTNSQIAQRLIISKATANFHVSSVLRKLGAQTRTGAVAVALQDRLVA